MDLATFFTHLPINIKKHQPVSGGDIHKSYKLEAEEGIFFIKMNTSSAYPQIFEKERNGLNFLYATQTLLTPKIIEVKEVENIQYLLMEWIERREANSEIWRDFGNSLALMHQIPQAYFGFEEDNYIGNLVQLNTQSSSWEELYGKYHILPLVKVLFEQGKFNREDIKRAEVFCRRIKDIFPEEPPSLVHGDLWNGNYVIYDKGKAVLIDPAVYYGHREMDLGMTRLFGGFASDFYEAYQETYPLEKDWIQRLPYTQLYPLLVHAVLFGGYYVSEVQYILREF